MAHFDNCFTAAGITGRGISAVGPCVGMGGYVVIQQLPNSWLANENVM